MGSIVLNLEKLSSLFCQVEAVVSSFSNGTVWDDSNDEVILIPAHLICGRWLESIPTKETKWLSELQWCSPAEEVGFHKESAITILEQMEKRICVPTPREIQLEHTEQEN